MAGKLIKLLLCVQEYTRHTMSPCYAGSLSALRHLCRFNAPARPFLCRRDIFSRHPSTDPVLSMFVCSTCTCAAHFIKYASVVDLAQLGIPQSTSESMNFKVRTSKYELHKFHAQYWVLGYCALWLCADTVKVSLNLK